MVQIPQKESTVVSLINFGKLFCLIGIALSFLNLFFRLIISNWQLLDYKTTIIYLSTPYSSFIFLTFGISIWLKRGQNYSKTIERISDGTVYFFLFIHFAIRILIYFGVNLDIELLFVSKEEYESFVKNKFISWNSLNLVLLAITLLLIDSKNSFIRKNLQFLNYYLILFSMLSIYGFVFQIEVLYKFDQNYLPISLLTTLIIFFYSSSLLFLRPNQGSMRLLIGENPTKVIFIRFFALMAPLIFGWFETLGEKNDLYSKEFGKALLTTFSFALTMSLIGVKAKIQFNARKHKKKLNMRIKKERKRLQRILKFSPTLINIVDINNDKLLYTNTDEEDFFKKWGLKLDKSLGWKEKINKVTHPEDLDKVKEGWEKLKDLDEDQYDDLVYRIGNKEKSIWYFSRRLLFRKKNGVHQIMTNAVDITKQEERVREVEKKKEELAETKERLEDTADQLEGANKELEEEVDERKNELEKSDRRYKGLLQQSFEGFLNICFKPVNLKNSQAEIAELILNNAKVEEANNSIAQLYGYDKPEEMKGLSLDDVWRGSKVEKIETIITFIKCDFRLAGIEVKGFSSSGKDIKYEANVIGVVEEQKLMNIWIISKEEK